MAEGDGGQPKARSIRQAIAGGVLVVAALGVTWFVMHRGNVEETKAAAAWLHGRFEEVRSKPAAFRGETPEEIEAWNAIAASDGETTPEAFDFDTRGTNTVLICANMALKKRTPGAETKLAVVMVRTPSENGPAYEIRELSTSRACHCHPDLVARCALEKK